MIKISYCVVQTISYEISNVIFHHTALKHNIIQYASCKETTVNFVIVQ